MHPLPYRVHTIAFGGANATTANFLQTLAQATQGRFQECTLDDKDLNAGPSNGSVVHLFFFLALEVVDFYPLANKLFIF